MNRRAGIPLMIGIILTLAISALGVRVATAQAVSAGSGLSALQKRHLSGVVSVALDSDIAMNQASVNAQAFGGLGPTKTPNYFPAPNGECEPQTGSNIEVNQNCLNLSDSDLQGRAQAQNETSIAQDPNAPKHLVAAFNDYRRGDGTCGTAWSVDGGNNWVDSTLPNGFVNGATFGAAREYFQAGGDPSVAWDTKGNAYLTCQMFMRGQPTNNPGCTQAAFTFSARPATTARPGISRGARSFRRLNRMRPFPMGLFSSTSPS